MELMIFKKHKTTNSLTMPTPKVSDAVFHTFITQLLLGSINIGWYPDLNLYSFD
jgi:hypothetical protein